MFPFTAPPIIEGNAETATVMDLIPWTEYDFRVIATNTLGIGEPSDPLHKVSTLGAGIYLFYCIYQFYNVSILTFVYYFYLFKFGYASSITKH